MLAAVSRKKQLHTQSQAAASVYTSRKSPAAMEKSAPAGNCDGSTSGTAMLASCGVRAEKIRCETQEKHLLICTRGDVPCP